MTISGANSMPGICKFIRAIASFRIPHAAVDVAAFGPEEQVHEPR